MTFKSAALLCFALLSSSSWGAEYCAPVAASCSSLPTGSVIIMGCYKFERSDIPGLEQDELNIQSQWTKYRSEDQALGQLVSAQRWEEADKKASSNSGLINKIESDSHVGKTKADDVASQISQWSQSSQSEASNYISEEQQKAQAAAQRMDHTSAQRHSMNAQKGQACLKAIPEAERPLAQEVKTLSDKFQEHLESARTEKQNLASKINTIKSAKGEEGKENSSSSSKPAPEGEEVAKGKKKKITRFGYEGDKGDEYTDEGIAEGSQKDPEIRRAAKAAGDEARVAAYDAGKKAEFYKPDTLLREGDIALSPDLAKGMDLMQPIDVTYTNPDGTTQTIQGRFSDTTADNLSGRVDLYDPNNKFKSIDGATVTKITKSTRNAVQPDAAFRSFQEGWRGGFAGDYERDAAKPTAAPSTSPSE